MSVMPASAQAFMAWATNVAGTSRSPRITARNVGFAPAVTFFSPVVAGRTLSGQPLPLLVVWALHMGVSILYGLIVCRVVAGLKQARAILTGGLLGLVLYVINFGIVSTWWPSIRGNEISVVFTHIVFGLVVAGAYRGLLRRKGGFSPSQV